MTVNHAHLGLYAHEAKDFVEDWDFARLLFLLKGNMKHCSGVVSFRRHKLLETDMPKGQELRVLYLKPFIHLVCVDVVIVG